ncbi:hypothetical protein CONPUDRAFT_143001 [Coniophora puteana RWD-64-598 SS2]|uniref:F-box domain-containing protein n=1 Tax=Coniophora puteana (strain RWD-64-598) TaxID=741705 RepID=A0A5M3MW09_CONPW|nr:uncharacterized protein CONPUDRAFT_143001 [Coniophora puteana RWD-64-598 SS2]EIW82895.1 hypothetical protein CONPUDRAFT_143001 [Coniophora puteana RWD-64-598 SS2]
MQNVLIPTRINSRGMQEDEDTVSRQSDLKLLEKLRALLAPAMRLPPEIVCMIFEQCMPPNNAGRRHPTETPLSLGRVCGAWRNLANTCPVLWARLDIHLPNSSSDWYKTTAHILAAIEKWTTCSNNRPLALSLVDYGGFPPIHLPRIAHALCSHAHRWSSIDLYVSSRCFAPLNRLLYSNNLSALEKLTMHESIESHRSRREIWRPLPNYPRLTSLSWATNYVDETLLVDWSHLTELSLLWDPTENHIFRYSHMLRILSQVQNLVTLNVGLTIELWYDIDHEAVENVVLPRLNTLRIRRPAPLAMVNSFFERLVVPALRNLELDGIAIFHCPADPWYLSRIAGMLERSQCDLERLSVVRAHVTEEELLKMLQWCPHLKELVFEVVRGWTTPRQLIDRLTALPQSADGRGEASVWLPYLERLELIGGLDKGMPLREIGGMVASRRTSFAHDTQGLNDFVLRLAAAIHDPEERHPDLRDLQVTLEDCSQLNTHLQARVQIDRMYEPSYLTVQGAL